MFSNLLMGSTSGTAPTQIGVDSTSATVVSENLNRVGLIMTNLSDGTVYLGFGANAAVLGSGIPMLPGGGNFSMDDYTATKEAIQAIAHTDNALLSIQEFVIRS